MYIFLFITLLLILLTICTLYFYHENKRKKDEQQTKKSLVTRVERFKLKFKDSISPITASGDLTQEETDALFRIANYYFVFQAMSVENVDKYEQQLGVLLNLIEENVLSERNDEDISETTPNGLVSFVHSLPIRVEGFGPSFYRNDLPVLMQKLITIEVGAPEFKESEESLVLD